MRAKAGVKTKHLLDKINIDRGLNRRFSNLDFSNSVFPANMNKQQLNYLKSRLCKELAYRIQAEIRAAQKKYHNDFNAILRTVFGAISSIDFKL